MRDPVPPQSLVNARNEARTIITQNLAQSEDAARRLKAWHNEVKNWQDGDSLEDAFAEGRLTLRSMSHENKDYDYGKVPANRKKILGLINNDAYQRTINDAGTKVGDYWEKGADIGQVTAPLDAGATGILKRMNPENFLKNQPSQNAGGAPHSSKYRLGLHQLSTSLLNPDNYKLKHYDGTHLVVLMPLPLAEDVKLFYDLRKQAKLGACHSFKAAVEILASEFTRPVLASALDMGTTYVMVQKQDGDGVRNQVKLVKGVGEKVTSKDSPQTCYEYARTNYRDILTGLDQANEVTVAFRKWGTRSVFPIFAIAGLKKNFKTAKFFEDFVEVNIELPPPQRALPKFGGSALKQPPKWANYQDTGWVISGKDFKKRREVIAYD